MSLQLLSLAVVGAVLYSVLKKDSPSISILFAVSVAVSTLLVFCNYLETTLEWLNALQNATGQIGFSVLIKAAGIILCADYGRDLCKDAGSESMATCVSLTGRVMVLVVSLPLLESIYLAIQELTK